MTAHARTAQPQPTPGREDVTPRARELFLQLLADQEQKGIAAYGTTLQTFNGRDVALDLLQELVDAFQYAVQFQAEHAALLRHLTRLEGALARFAHLPLDRDAPLDTVLAEVGQRKIFAADVAWARKVLNTPLTEA